jgi:DNA-binding NarL/FixJ family response regulator
MPSDLETPAAQTGTTELLRVLVVQDHPLLASALALIIEAEADLRVCGVARTGSAAEGMAVKEKPSVVLIDFYLPDMTGPTAAGMIRAREPDVAIVFHSAEESEWALLDAIDAGATAYLTKSATADQIVEAIRRTSKGEVQIPVSLFAKAIARQQEVAKEQHSRDRLSAQFTSRELAVLKLMAQGLDTNAMSQRLGVAPHTIEWHVRHVIEKLGVHSRLQAVIAAARAGLIQLPSPGASCVDWR